MCGFIQVPGGHTNCPLHQPIKEVTDYLVQLADGRLSISGIMRGFRVEEDMTEEEKMAATIALRNFIRDIAGDQ